MSKHWTPAGKALAPKPSRIRREPVRIRREPVRLPTAAELKKAEALSREREIWGGIAGILLIAAALVAVIVGISIATFVRDDPAAAARARQFGQCYNAFGANCVVDGATIYVAGDKVRIAGMITPAIQDSRCADERTRGIAAAERLADLLNRGSVTVGPTFRDETGREVRKVEVKGEDVAQKMIDANLARPLTGNTDWCG